MAKLITQIDVRNHVKDHEIDLSQINGNPTLLGGIAKAVTRALNDGKSPQQLIQKVTTMLINVRGEQVAAEATEQDGLDDSTTEADRDEAFTGSLDDFDTKLAASASELASFDEEGNTPGFLGRDEADAEEDAAADEAEAASPTDEEGESEEKVDRSVVKGKYRKEYAQRGNARNCGDWMARICDGILLGAKKKLNIDHLRELCELNEQLAKFLEYTTAEKRLNNGWQGRARMSTGLGIRVTSAKNNALTLSRPLFDYMCTKLDVDNRNFIEKGKPEQVVEFQVFEDADDIVLICPLKGTRDANFFAEIIRKHGVNNEKLAEGRKKNSAKKKEAPVVETV